MSVKVEWIPAHIQNNSEAKVDSYFDSRVREGKNGVKVGFFRGRELNGKEVEPVEGYKHEVVRIVDDKINKELDVSKMTIWDLQLSQVSKVDDFNDAITIANALADD